MRSPFTALLSAAPTLEAHAASHTDSVVEAENGVEQVLLGTSAPQQSDVGRPPRAPAWAALALTAFGVGMGLAHSGLCAASEGVVQAQIARLASPRPAAQAPSTSATGYERRAVVSVGTSDSFPTTEAETRLADGVQAMVDGTAPTPEYLAGYHPTWTDNNDHCYSVYFRVAIRLGLVHEAQAEAIMARFPVNDELRWLDTMFPQGYQTIPLIVTPTGVELRTGAIPRGQLVSFDSNAHVMMSTGRTLADGRHEVYSFKGGGPETPSWGDSVGYDPAARVHITTLEDELQALHNDDQPIVNVRVVAGHSVLGLLPASHEGTR